MTSAWLGAFALGLSLVLVPHAFIRAGRREAIACFRTFESPRGADLPWCGDAMSWYSFPSALPWTRTPATYQVEELRIRIAHGQYHDAIAGHPRREARALAAARMEEAATIVRTGSQRLAFEELGPAIGAPDPGQDAFLLGDRDTLLRRGKDWLEWPKRLHALQAALLEGDFAGATDLARHYATYDPREEDLRSAVGGVLCLAGETKRGIEMLELQQNDRASRRYAGMARGFGEVRSALLACAALGGREAPPRPNEGEAGEDDRRDARVPLELDLLRDHDNRIAAAQEKAEDMLSGRLESGLRAPILAALVDSNRALSARALADLALPRTNEGEAPMLDLDDLGVFGNGGVVSWLEVPRGRPMAPGAVLRRAAEKLLDEAAGPEGEKTKAPAPAGGKASAAASEPSAAEDPIRRALEEAAGALLVEGARAFVREGDREAAADLVERATPLARLSPGTRALLLGMVHYACGDGERAHNVLSNVDDPSMSPRQRAALLTLRAEVRGGWGPPSPDEATAALEAAVRTGEGALIAWARRVRFWALPTSEPPSKVPVAGVDVMAGRSSLWPSLGHANPTVRWAGAVGPRMSLLDANLGVWSAARAAGEDDKRAYRHAFLRHRGDMPDTLVPFLAVAADIAGAGADPEIWLDAVMAIDASRFSLRTYAWARAEAARARGDRESHATWRARLAALTKLGAGPYRAELTRFLGI